MPYLTAFYALDRRRQMGYATPQPLTASDILAYGRTFGFKTDLSFFFRVIDALDTDYMEEVAQKQKAEIAKSKAKSKVKKSR